MNVRILAAVLLAAMLSGCVNQAREIKRYRSILDAGVEGPVAPLVPGEPLTLRRALLLANQDNESLAIHGEDYVQAWANKDRAFSAFLPTLSLAPSYTIADYPGHGTGTSGSAVGTIGGFKIRGHTQRRFEVPVTASANLFRGFRDRAALEASVAAVEQQRQLLLDAQASLLLDVAQTYYHVLRLEEAVKVIEKSLQSLRERQREAEVKNQAGMGKPLDIAQAKAQVATRLVELVQARGDVTNARTLLAFLIGSRGTISGPLADEFAVPQQLAGIAALLQAASEQREDLKAASAAVEAAKHDVTGAIGQYYPSVSLNITGFLHREAYSDASKWNAVLTINLPIFSAGMIEADVRAAWSRLRQAALAHSLLRRQVEQEVRTRYENLQTSRNRLTELNLQLEAGRQAYQLARGELGAGTAKMLDVLTAEDVLRRAELDLANEQFNGKVQYLDLLRTTGRLDVRVGVPSTRPDTRPATRPV